jgi:hypothetical protein
MVETQEHPLTAEAKKLTNYGFVIIPLNDKIAIIKYRNRRKVPATTREIDLWFSNGDGRIPMANGIAIAINNTEFGIDTDGEKCESIFLNIISKLSAELQDKIHNTMHTKTPHGHHRTFKFIPEDYPDGIKEKTYLKINGEHSEIALKGKDHYFVERGPGYQIINDVEALVTLSKTEVNELLGALAAFGAEHEGLTRVIKKLLPYYVKPNRDSIIFALSGYLHKGRTPEHKIIEIAQRLIETTGYSDENPGKVLQTIKDTCAKDPDSDQVSGYKRLHEALKLAMPPDSKTDDVSNAIVEIEHTLKGIGLFTIHRKEHQQAQQELIDENPESIGGDDYEINELKGIDDAILTELDSHVFALVSSSPPVLYVAYRPLKCIMKFVIRFGQGETIDPISGQNSVTKTQTLLPKQKLIYAIPTKVVINDNPINNAKTYQITFIDRSKKPFTIGPGSINYIIEELTSKGKVLKKNDAVDALTAILNRYEERGLAKIKESVTQPGYYYIKGKFETHEITQVLDKEPDPNQVIKCTEFLDELATKWINKDIFPTVIKWTTLAPFNYIFKAIDKWLKNTHGYGWSSSGKTSLGKIALAVWRLHTNALRKDYQLRFSNMDNTARFGSVISRSTYPKLINEVGGLQDKSNRSLLELIKGAIEAPYVRGKFLDGRYQNIPAFCNMFLTSNSKPPVDSGYRSRTTLLQHTKDDVHERGQKEAVEFEQWLDSKLNILGVLGDFIARYVIVKPAKPEESILFHSDKSHEDMAKEILTEFYKSVGKDKPEWLDKIFEQRSIVEENTEWAYFEVRGFLMDHITEAYSRHIRTLYKEQDPGVVIDFHTRLNFCMTNKLISFLHVHTKKDGTEEVVITHDILKELTKKLDHIEGITTLEDLGKEIPGFNHCQRKLGPDNKNTKVLAGKRGDFVDFLEGQIGDEDA